MYSDQAETYGLLKLGGSDYHGKGGHDESELGSVNISVTILRDFLNVARPIWCSAIKSILETYSEEPSDLNLARIMKFARTWIVKGSSPSSCAKDIIDKCLSAWLTGEESQNTEFEAIRLKLSDVPINVAEIRVA